MRNVYLVPFAVAILVLLAVGGYTFVIPRSALEVRTVYHETPGGGGTGGIINVNVLLTNKGNRQIEGLKCQASVMGPGGRIMDMTSAEGLSISPGNNAELKMVFTGSQYDDYDIEVHLRYDCRGQTHIHDLAHTTSEDEMNLVYVDDL